MLIEVKHDAVPACIDYFNTRFFAPLAEKGATNLWIAGGAVRDWFTHRRPQADIDFWFANMEDWDKAKKAAEELGWRLEKETPASVNFKHKGQWIQFIKKHFFKDMEDSLNNFDFTVCCGAVDKNRVLVHQDFFIDLAMRRLAFHALPYPAATFKRAAKYTGKGFKFCPTQQNRLLEALKTELNTITLEEANSLYMD